MQLTGADGVMVSEAILENPAIYTGKLYDPDEMALEYLQLTKKYDEVSNSNIKGHLFKMLFTGLQ